MHDTQTWSKSTLFKPCKSIVGPGPKHYQEFLAQDMMFISRFVRLNSLKERSFPIVQGLDGSQCQYETNGKIFAINTSTTRPDIYSYYSVLRLGLIVTCIKGQASRYIISQVLTEFIIPGNSLTSHRFEKRVSKIFKFVLSSIFEPRL